MAFEFHAPLSLDAAIALARQHGEAARFIAGGTDLVIQIRRRRLAPQHLISLAGLGLDTIRETDSEVVIGATTTHNDVVFHPAFQKQLVALTEASALVGGRQIRNVATVGGNIVNASPAADLVPVLLTLDAVVELAGTNGTRRLPIDDFLLDRGRADRRDEEVLTAVRFARPPQGSATAFLKGGRRKAMEISVVCVAAGLAGPRASGGYDQVRLAIGAAASRTFRPLEAERLVAAGGAFGDAGQLVADASAPIDDVRASARYRRLLVAALVERALARCRERLP